ncbi:MAG: D-alanyl-D-alanine carboxypeptidase/D-alanyl-D-alanine-endopeptidase [Methanobacteriaceae archaeon]|nr:D-alanyl-D-alanine carboxypeptidase/D-alanyl-D-alanine-endopeptidase [Methanobacteriaceae archaeon]
MSSTINASYYNSSSWGILIEDMESGEIIYEKNANQMFVPGSVAKIFICAAALDAYGPEYKFETPVYYTGEVDDEGALKGDLILVAQGDPTMNGRNTPDGRINFTNLDHGDANTIEGVNLTSEDPLNGLNDLARQVKSYGIKRVDGDVIIDDRLFETELSTTGEYMISPIMINDNLIDFEITPGRVGENASVKWRPQTSTYNVTSQIITVDSGETNITVNDHGSGRIILKGQIPAGSDPVIRTYTIKDPSNFARSLFIEALQREGVNITAPLKGENPQVPNNNTYSEENRVAVLTSLPFSENIKLILKVSQNQQADTLVSLLAARNKKKTFDEGMNLEGDYLKKAGLNPDSIALSDGRGGSPSDRISPRASDQLLRYISQQPYFQSFYDGLPIMGYDGTLVGVVNNSSPLYGNLRAKTGTNLADDKLFNQGILLGKSKAGYMETKSGRRLIISIFINNLPVDSFDQAMNVQKDMAYILEAVYENY